MKLIKQGFNVVNQEDFSEKGIYKHIELCTRVSYKSEDKITESSAEKFVLRLITLGHYAPLEFGTIHLKVPMNVFNTLCLDLLEKDIYNYMWFDYNRNPDGYYYISLNFRYYLNILGELNYIQDFVDYTNKDNDKYPKRITIKFITSRVIAQEITRHRAFSFMMESQRYCNYTKGKFSNQITYIIPSWTNLKEGTYSLPTEDDENTYLWKVDNKPIVVNTKDQRILNCYSIDEQVYFSLLQEKNYTPQQARVVLCNNVKTELYVCGNEDAWKHFFELRDDIKVDPQMYDLVHPLHKLFVDKDIVS